jgi:D-apionolactonase
VLGRDAFPDPPVPVRAGQLAGALDGADVRWVSLGEVAIVHGIRVSVRDSEWGTVPGLLSENEREIRPDSFLATFSCRHRDAEVDFSWHGEVHGRRNGTISYEMRGRAGRAFGYGRIGIDVLHPLACAGRAYVARTTEGEVEGVLPEAIGPQEFRDGVYLGLFDPFTELELEVDDGLIVRFELEGDLFEMEDQRNWTDASFKTYCTPLARGLRHDAHPGQEFLQRVIVTPLATSRTGRTRRSRDEAARVELLAPVGRALPSVGLQLSGTRLDGQETERLRALRLDHLRVDLPLEPSGWQDAVERASADATLLGAPLELALHVPEGELPDLRPLAGKPLARVLVFRADSFVTPGPLVAEVRERLRPLGIGCPVGGGSNASFAELNAERPDAGSLDFVSYPISPQLHAFDECSLVETLPIQSVTVENARSSFVGRPIAITPVTLLPRAGADAVSPNGQLGADVDPRGASLFGAAWTLGSIAQLAAAGVESVTYYETVGLRGLLLSETHPAPPPSFPGRPGYVFPVYHVFAGLALVRKHELLGTAADGASVTALAARVRSTTHVALANLSASTQRVDVGPFASAGAALRLLDATTAGDSLGIEAPRIPERTIDVVADRVTLELPPYALAWIAG